MQYRCVINIKLLKVFTFFFPINSSKLGFLAGTKHSFKADRGKRPMPAALGHTSHRPCSCPQLVSHLHSCLSSALSRSRVVSPVIDVIDWKTFQYSAVKQLQRGVLDWKLDFRWEPLGEQEQEALPSPISPIR